MTATAQQAIRAWLTAIGEADPATVEDVIQRCAADSESLAYFLGRAAEAPRPANPCAERINRVAARLDADPALTLAIETHPDSVPGFVIVALAIRNKAACELTVPSERWDSFALLELLAAHTERPPQ